MVTAVTPGPDSGHGHSTGSSSCTPSPDYSDAEAGWGFLNLFLSLQTVWSHLWQPVRTDTLLKGFVVKVGGYLGLVRGLFPVFLFFFFLVLHLNTLQQRNWKSCLKVGHSSAVSIETSSQRAVRFTSTEVLSPAAMGYSRLSPLTRVLRSTLEGDRGTRLSLTLG